MTGACIGDRSSHKLEVWALIRLMHGWKLFASKYVSVASTSFLVVWWCVERWRGKTLHGIGEALQVALWSCICFQYIWLSSIYASY